MPFFAPHFIYVDALRRMIQSMNAYVQNMNTICNVFFVYDKMKHICMYRYTKLIKFSVYPCVRARVCTDRCAWKRKGEHTLRAATVKASGRVCTGWQ